LLLPETSKTSSAI